MPGCVPEIPAAALGLPGCVLSCLELPFFLPSQNSSSSQHFWCEDYVVGCVYVALAASSFEKRVKTPSLDENISWGKTFLTSLHPHMWTKSYVYTYRTISPHTLAPVSLLTKIMVKGKIPLQKPQDLI
jgi:hypothetical protein